MRYLLQEKIGQQPSSDIATTGWKPKSHAVLLIMQVFISHSVTDSRDKVSQSIPSSSVTCRQSLKKTHPITIARILCPASWYRYWEWPGLGAGYSYAVVGIWDWEGANAKLRANIYQEPPQEALGKPGR